MLFCFVGCYRTTSGLTSRGGGAAWHTLAAGRAMCRNSYLLLRGWACLYEVPMHERGSWARCRRKARRLVSAHDRFHAHKLLGLLCIANLLSKTVRLAAGQPMFPADALLAAHLAVALAALMFRIVGHGTRIELGYITRESRAHTILFTSRQVCTPSSELLARPPAWLIWDWSWRPGAIPYAPRVCRATGRGHRAVAAVADGAALGVCAGVLAVPPWR